MINKDLGYYVCNGVEFQSKIDALIYATTADKEVHWMFHNDLFQQYSWEIEPQESLDYFYDKRARELREQYDYIVLSYSGGSDTNNILEAFLRQGLLIDEIITNHITKATSAITVLDPNVRNSWNFAAEHELQAVPRLKYISEKSPRTKITILDVSDIVLNSMNQFDDVDWVLKRNEHLSIGMLFRYNYFHFANIKKQFDKNLKVAIIVGLEKPKTCISQDGLYMSFMDTVANITTINEFNSDYDNVKVEMFYWSKDCLPMLCKQAHTIKKWLEENPKMMLYWRLHATINGVYFDAGDLNRLVHEKVLPNVVYTTWDKKWFQTNKSIFLWNTDFDTWFRKDPNLNRHKELWKRGVSFLEEKIPNYIVYKNHLPDRTRVFKHNYYIGKMKGSENV
jgi:hypothetical protein